jgi:hypothetical protein
MATRTVISLHDDLTDEPADTTVSFGLDGEDYEIDLTDANAEELREMMEPTSRRVARRAAYVGVAGVPALLRAWIPWLCALGLLHTAIRSATVAGCLPQ